MRTVSPIGKRRVVVIPTARVIIVRAVNLLVSGDVNVNRFVFRTVAFERDRSNFLNVFAAEINRQRKAFGVLRRIFKFRNVDVINFAVFVQIEIIYTVRLIEQFFKIRRRFRLFRQLRYGLQIQTLFRRFDFNRRWCRGRIILAVIA